MEHLFFECSLAKYVWGVFGMALNAPCVPSSFGDLCIVLFNSFVGKNRVATMIGSIAAIWAMLKTRNRSCFQKIRPGDPTNVIPLACHFISISGRNYREADYERCC